MNKYTIGLAAVILCIAAVWIIRYHPNFSTQKRTTNANYITVGTNAEYPPFTTIENGKITGFDIDLIHAVGKKLNKKIILHNMPFDTLIPEVQLGHISIIAAGMTATPMREKQLFFTTPYLEDDPLVAITLDSTASLNTVHDLHNKNVVVNEGYTADNYLSQYEDTITINRLATPAEAILAIKSGRADVFVAALSSIKPFLSQEKNKQFIKHTLHGVGDSYSLAITKKDPELFAQVNSALEELKKDGTIDALKQTWDV